MLVTALAAGGLMLGLRPAAVVLVVATATVPPLGLAAAVPVAFAWRRRLQSAAVGDVDEAAFCASLAAELNAGASLRHALAGAAGDRPSPAIAAAARAALAGDPPALVASRLEEGLPANGRHAALAYHLASDTGSGVGAVFTRLAARAARVAEVRREKHALTAQARLSAAIVGGVPIAAVALLLTTGRLQAVVGRGAAGFGVIAAGLALVVCGLVVVRLMLGRAT